MPRPTNPYSRRAPQQFPPSELGRHSATPASLQLQKEPLRILLFLLMIITISRVHGYVGLSALRPALVLALLAGAYALLNPRTLNTTTFSRTWPTRVMAGLGMMALISVPFGISMGGSASFIIEHFSKVLIFAFLLVLAIRHVNDLYTFVWAYVLSCGILIILAVVIVGITKTQGMMTYDPNDIGLVLLVGLPLALATMQSAESKAIKFISAGVLCGVGVVLALSLSRGSFLGLVAVGLALLFLLKRVSIFKRLTFVAIAAISLALTAPSDYWEAMETMLNPTADYNWQTDYGRKAVWERGIGYMLSNPLTGHGIGNFPRAEGTISEPALSYIPGSPGRIKWSVAHNSFLEVGADMGFPGLILFASLVFGGIIAMLGLRKRLPSYWVRGDPQERFLYYLALYMPVSLLAFAVTGSFISFAYQDIIYILAAMMAGLYVSVDQKTTQNQRLRAGTPPAAQSFSRRGWRVQQQHGSRKQPTRPGAVACSRSSPGGWGVVPPP